MSDRRVSPGDPDCAAKYRSNLVSNSKYTVWSFIPKNIYEQFGRPLNLYFLLIAWLQLISIIAPVNPLSTIIPLVFAFSLTAIKEGLDDRERHIEDAKFNSRRYDVVTADGGVQSVESQEIRVGDVVKVRKGEEIPCDLFLMKSSDEDGVAYIRTDNLDGEIDLKPRCCVDGHIVEDIKGFKGSLVYAPPDQQLYVFNARLDMDDGSTHAVSYEQLLLQSCFLQNTEYVYGLAVYTGSDTKCGQNKQDPPIKWAGVDRQVSHYSIYVFIFQLMIAFGMGIAGNVVHETKAKDAWYLHIGSTKFYEYLIIPMRFFLLTSVMIPISFKVIIDISKYYISLVIDWDITMYDANIDEGGTPAKANSTALAEDLGQIKCILTDKTGTLTDNIMEFKACSLGGVICGGGSGTVFNPSISPFDMGDFEKRKDDAFMLFAKVLGLCHTVALEDGKLAASSPDEEALVKAAGKMRVKFTERTKKTITVNYDGEEQVYEIVHVMEFNSDRRMMSMLLREKATGKVSLMSKGGDDKMNARMAEGEGVEALNKHLGVFASAGLRTLVLGYRDIPAEEFEKWAADLDKASKVTGGERDNEVEQVYSSIERDYTLVGATAIEDKLQDGVPETIVKLREAGINFWMLTGDKFETAKQIARSCGLWGHGETLLTLSYENAKQLDYDLQKLLEKVQSSDYRASTTINEQYGTFPVPPNTTNEDDALSNTGSRKVLNIKNRKKRMSGGDFDAPQPTTQLEVVAGSDGDEGFVLIVEGKTVHHLLEDHIKRFKELCSQVNSVICCRVTPSQKAGLTRMAKTDLQYVEDAGCVSRPLRRGRTHAKVLSVGDGGNDVAMIQEATVGVGIVGKEGRQASRAADYSIARFRFLQPLLLVHGQYSYQRSCYIVQYCFYKSMLLAIIQIVFNFFAMFSGVSYWNSLLLTTWNSLFAVPVPFYVFDKILPRHKLISNPVLYKESQKGVSLTKSTFGWFVGRGAVQGVICLLCTLIIFGDSVSADAQPMDFQPCFTVTYTTIVMIQVWTVILESHSMTAINLFGIFFMPPLYLAFIAAYAAIPFLEYYGVATRVFTDPVVWLTVILLTAAIFLPSYASYAWQENHRPTPFQAARRRKLPMDPMMPNPHIDFSNLETSASSPLARHESPV